MPYRISSRTGLANIICPTPVQLSGFSSGGEASSLCQASFLQPLSPFATLGSMTANYVLLKVIGSVEFLGWVALAKFMDLI